MLGSKWLTAVALLGVGAAVGAAAIVLSTEVNRRTSTDTFCTSCHSMATLASDSHFTQSVHQRNAAGVRVGCGDCHIPAGNWFSETYTHVSMGMKDVIAEYTHNFNDPATWEKRRTELAAEVRDDMRSNDGATCRKCHDATAIRPTNAAGRAAHAMVQQGRVTCIDCHFNLAHAPVAPSASFIQGSGLGAPSK
ncbi:MAG: NapC/NirT family cytochrome c [Bradyrhizobiaceae bacterium]|nr:NapC/NirT family cytochrome c [Bradyrhizobiaceae bacterium]